MEQNTELLKRTLAGSLAIIEQDREREIISKRFGLEGEKETLEQIGEALSITREKSTTTGKSNSYSPSNQR